MKVWRPKRFCAALEYFFSLRSANTLPRVSLKEQIRESPNPEYKRRPAS